MLSLIWAWIKDWVNNRESGDLRRHRADYGVFVMLYNIIVGDLYMHCANVATDIFSKNLPSIVLFIDMLSDSQILPDY